jgi:two-component system sensor histidine kinase KdpD
MSGSKIRPGWIGTGSQASRYFWSILSVGVTTGCFWLARAYLDKGQASLLYLPVVIACSIFFGFGPAVLCAILSFLCWDFFFLPPFYTFVVTDPKNWISLFVFLLTAISTARMASMAREQAQRAQAREGEIATLFQASESLSHEIRADSLLATLVQLLQTLCDASRCVVFRSDTQGGLHLAAGQSLNLAATEQEKALMLCMAGAAYENRQVIGFGTSPTLWTKALDAIPLSAMQATPSTLGVYVPLQAESSFVGVLHIGPRLDRQPFSSTDERLILTLANHAAVGIARADLARQAAQAEALREADALKDTLLSLVSHELRTPLAAIKALITGMLDPRAVLADESRSENLRAVDRETDRLNAVVGNLLDLSRLEAGAWHPHKDWCDLAELIATSLDHLPEEQAARVHINLPDNLPLLRADYTQLALVLTNLLGNAAKYTPGDSPIQIFASATLSEQQASPEGVTLTIRDFGPGIAPDEEERLFERFYRGQLHRDSAVHGSGLGLALCRIIIEAHGGRIWASNAPNGEPHGAMFSLFLPIDDNSQKRSDPKNYG